MKGHGPLSGMYGELVEGKNYQGKPAEEDDESSEVTPDNEANRLESMHIESAENGHHITVYHKHVATKKESTPQPPSKHVFPVEHPVTQHIHAILKHTKGKKTESY